MNDREKFVYYAVVSCIYSHSLLLDCVSGITYLSTCVYCLGMPPVVEYSHVLPKTAANMTVAFQVVVWRSGSVLISINEVNLRRSRLVLGWVHDRVRTQFPVPVIYLRM